MRILSIGNSYSQDAQKWLHKLAKLNGIDLETANLFIGGCSLETHWNNLKENLANYEISINANEPERKISIEEALNLNEWDIITVQQVSNFSGIYESYEPYISSLVEYVRTVQPNAEIYLHQTWAYEIDSNHGGFANYNYNQTQMYNCIVDANNKVAKLINSKIIPSGKVIQLLRDTVPEFDYKNGGISLCRDGFHLSLDYGRFAVAATWLRTLTGCKLKEIEFEDFDFELLKKIIGIVNSLL